MILKFLIEIVSFLAVSFAQVILGIFNIPDLSSSFGLAVNMLIEFCTQAVNFMYFLIGDMLIVITPLAIALVPIRLLVAPLVAFLRGFIRWGS